ncbi:MAG: DMT family transporter [Pelagimonas sp.]|jgi:drug/metabolite transporter (DMT)-like permease|nr:DMT family transporter [Pelagimonas sp.]
MTQQRVSASISARAWGELCLLGVIWGGIFLAVRVALDFLAPLQSVFLRTGLAACLLWLVIWLRRGWVRLGWRDWGWLAVMGALNNVLPFSLMAWAQLHIASGLTAILNASTALFGVALAALAFADEPLNRRRGVGVAAGFAGVVVIIGPESLLMLNINSLPQISVLVGTLSYACAGIVARKRLSHLPPVTAAAGMLGMSTLLILPPMLWVEGPPPLDLPLQAWAAVLYYAVVATALAYLLYYRVLAMAGAGNLMLVTLIIPPVAIVLGAWVRNETLSSAELAGLALLALGLVITDGRALTLLRRRA